MYTHMDVFYLASGHRKVILSPPPLSLSVFLKSIVLLTQNLHVAVKL